MVDRRLIHYFDWGLLVITLMICVVGLILLYSALSIDESTVRVSIFYRQISWIGLGLISMVVSFVFNYKYLDKWAPIIYAVSIVLLVCVHLFGKHAGGSTRWLALGPLTLQPSEPVKIGVIIILAQYFSHNVQKTGLTLRTLLPPMMITAVPFFLVATQPDLGTAGIIVLIGLSMAMFIKIDRRTFIAFVLITVIAVPVGWQVLAPYQKERVLTLLSPDKDPLGAGYHIRQSKIAVGSGLAFGKGIYAGNSEAIVFFA